MTKRHEIIIGFAATIGLLGACGGDPDTSGDSVMTSSTDSTTTTAGSAATESTTTTPTATTATTATTTPTAEPDDSGLPAWASGEMVTVDTDTGRLEMPVELAAFCESSRSFYIAARALDSVGDGQTGTAQQLFAALAAISPITIETAPSEQFAAEPKAARDQLAVIIPSFEQVGYDAARLSEIPDAESLADAVEAFGDTRNSLQQFLVEACGADQNALGDQAKEAAAIAAQAAGELVDPGDPVEPSDGASITNAASNITVAVPADWNETDETLQDGREVLAASSDLEGFFGLTTPGVLVIRGEGGLRDGGFGGRVFELQASLEEGGCTLVGDRDYDDGVYVGFERIFDCGTDGIDVRLLGGTTADETLYATVLLVNPVDDPGIRELIVTTFEVT